MLLYNAFASCVTKTFLSSYVSMIVIKGVTRALIGGGGGGG